MRYVIVTASLLLLLAGCGGNEEKAEEQPKATETQTEENKAEEPEEQEEQAAVNFREVEVTGEDGVVHITGDAQATNNTFYYRIEQGEKVLVEETEVVLDETSHGWGEFNVELPIDDEMREAEESPILVLYVKSSSGKEGNPNYIPLPPQIF